ncbi:MAG: EAL domain-containing protein [Ruminiclostridium sp.]|nr:EAL domain-containing protein [Ruminiclostridium sp.]
MEKYHFPEAEQTIMERLRIPFAVYQTIDGKAVTVLLSEGFRELFGHDDIENAYTLMGDDVFEGVHPDDRTRVIEATARFATGKLPGDRYEVVFRSKSRNNYDYTIIHSAGEHIYTDSGVRLAYVWYMNEGNFTGERGKELALTESLKNALHEESLISAIHYDHLTGLPSMTYFFELIAANRDNGNRLMMFMDLCRMKYFNHTYGFAEGDKLLCSFAKLLVRYFGKDNCSRLGQDHFAVYSDSPTAVDLLKSLFEEARWINGGLALPIHVGIYPQSIEKVGAAVACDRAKLACDSLKSAYISSYCYYDEAMNEAVMNRQYIIANLDRALSKRWIKVYYQPIVRAVNSRVCDEEALARWIDPNRGFMSPADFIPALEDSGLIYKLDLYVVDRVLEKLKAQENAGLHLVPQSVNLSRSDFDACDIVEEIRRRVDESGFSRSLITIEITESVIGSDFGFMKDRIERFRELGFAVWMDDFGSGYSSLDVLKSIKFDLLKFDMRFLQDFDESDSGKVILTEMIKMANFLGIDTVCEGVETSAQAHFLRETGCSKLQGYYYEKPIPQEKIFERYEKGIQIGFENPAESKYFEMIGRVNLHDLAVITQGSGGEFHNFFNMLPMAVIELNGDKVRVARSNKSYRDFVKRVFGSADKSDNTDYYSYVAQNAMPILMKVARKCCEDGSRSFVDVKMPDYSTVHYFVRRLANDPLNGTVAVVVVVLSIMEPGQGTDYANIAWALAADYFNLFYVNLDTEEFIAYTSGVGNEELADERRGRDFFAQARKDAYDLLYHEDRAEFTRMFTKENMVNALDKQGTFTYTYRLLIDGEPVYVIMKAMRMHSAGNYIIIGVSNIDTQMREKELLSRIERERTVYNRIMALSGDCIAMYTVDPVTEDYFVYNTTNDYEDLGFAKSGDSFFSRARSDGKHAIHPDDYDNYCRIFTKENVLSEIGRNKVFVTNYRLLMSGEPKSVTLRAALVKEKDGDKLIVSVNKV